MDSNPSGNTTPSNPPGRPARRRTVRRTLDPNTLAGIATAGGLGALLTAAANIQPILALPGLFILALAAVATLALVRRTLALPEWVDEQPGTTNHPRHSHN